LVQAHAGALGGELIDVDAAEEARAADAQCGGGELALTGQARNLVIRKTENAGSIRGRKQIAFHGGYGHSATPRTRSLYPD
jgi:hypothetical protein